MPGLGFIELIIVFLLILLLFGPKELPYLARSILKFINEMKNIFSRLKKEWDLLENDPKNNLPAGSIDAFSASQEKIKNEK